MLQPSIFQFLRQLKENNNREWFASNKKAFQVEEQLAKAFFMAVNADLEKMSLTEIALYNKYFDQSHFIRKFKDVTKTTPKTFNPDYYFLFTFHL